MTPEQEFMLEQLVMQEFSRAEQGGLTISRDCEVTLARRVAERLGSALFSIATIKDRIPFDAANAATECIRIAKAVFTDPPKPR